MLIQYIYAKLQNSPLPKSSLRFLLIVIMKLFSIVIMKLFSSTNCIYTERKRAPKINNK